SMESRPTPPVCSPTNQQRLRSPRLPLQSCPQPCKPQARGGRLGPCIRTLLPLPSQSEARQHDSNGSALVTCRVAHPPVPPASDRVSAFSRPCRRASLGPGSRPIHVYSPAPAPALRVARRSFPCAWKEAAPFLRIPVWDFR